MQPDPLETLEAHYKTQAIYFASAWADLKGCVLGHLALVMKTRETISWPVGDPRFQAVAVGGAPPWPTQETPPVPPPPAAPRSPPPPPATARGSRRFEVADGGKCVRTGNRNVFFTPKPAKAILLLWEKYQDGTFDVSERELLAVAGSKQGRLSELFADCPGWELVVIRTRVGYYRLKGPDD